MDRRHHGAIALTALGSALLVGSCGHDGARPELEALSLSLPAHVTATVAPSGCMPSATSALDVVGQVRFSGAGLRVIFTNDARFTHEASVDLTNDLAVVPGDFDVSVSTGEIVLAPDATTTIWVELVDDRGAVLGSPILLGRCADGLTPIDATVSVPTDVLLGDVVASDCANAPGPTIALDGHFRIRGLTLRFVFTTGGDPTDPSATVIDRPLELALLVPRTDLEIPKQPVRGGAGGNPWIYLEPIDANGAPLGEPTRIGRCVEFEHDHVPDGAGVDSDT